jgi:dephospho-CoA kinase
MIYIVTGDIAVGKSTVVQKLKEKYNCKTIDIDKEVHKWYNDPNNANFIVKAFRLLLSYTPDILTPENTIDRKKLGKLVFSNEAARLMLNDLMIMEVKSMMQTIIIHNKGNLLIECSMYFEYDLYKVIDLPIILVSCGKEIQLQRLMTRNNLSKEDAIKRMSFFKDIRYKIFVSDILIDNPFNDDIILPNNLFEE